VLRLDEVWASPGLKTLHVVRTALGATAHLEVRRSRADEVDVAPLAAYPVGALLLAVVAAERLTRGGFRHHKAAIGMRDPSGVNWNRMEPGGFANLLLDRGKNEVEVPLMGVLISEANWCRSVPLEP
jgi:hypothetical protein